jgi:hypothetical protein
MASFALGLAPGLYSYFVQGHPVLGSVGMQLSFGGGALVGALAGTALGIEGSSKSSDGPLSALAGLGLGSAAGAFAGPMLFAYLNGYPVMDGAIIGAVGAAAVVVSGFI